MLQEKDKELRQFDKAVKKFHERIQSHEPITKKELKKLIDTLPFSQFVLIELGIDRMPLEIYAGPGRPKERIGIQRIGINFSISA